MHHQCDYKKIQACINKNHKVYMGSKDSDGQLKKNQFSVMATILDGEQGCLS
jgi:hypothetical protein